MINSRQVGYSEINRWRSPSARTILVPRGRRISGPSAPHIDFGFSASAAKTLKFKEVPRSPMVYHVLLCLFSVFERAIRLIRGLP
jgi:hypothetical protein